MNGRLEEWREALESKGLRISRSKTEYIEYDFGEREHRGNRERLEIKLRGCGRRSGEVQVFRVRCPERWGFRRGYETQD